MNITENHLFTNKTLMNRSKILLASNPKPKYSNFLQIPQKQDNQPDNYAHYFYKDLSFYLNKSN